MVMETMEMKRASVEKGIGAVEVTVVLPTHFRPTLLRKALDSLEGQTYAHEKFEVIVVASENDAAFALVEEFRSRGIINVICVNVPDDQMKGKSAAVKRNYGVELARGKWVGLIDDDCIANVNWLSGASEFFGRDDIGGIEGRKEIPAPPKPTVTYKGLKSFETPGGFQTCNIFYRRDIFRRVGGFDLNFPFYLEDSDIAWTVLDAGHEIVHAEKAIVYHPVLAAQPWRMLADAKRASLMPYLYKKHPARYVAHGTKALRWGHWFYLMLYVALVTSLAMAQWWVALGLVGGVFALATLHSYKLFRGCSFTRHEFLVTNLLLLVSPVVKFVQLWRGNLKHKVWLWS